MTMMLDIKEKKWSEHDLLQFLLRPEMCQFFNDRWCFKEKKEEQKGRSCFTCEQSKLCFAFNRVLTSLAGVTMINIDSDDAPGKWGDVFTALGNACMEYKKQNG